MYLDFIIAGSNLYQVPSTVRFAFAATSSCKEEKGKTHVKLIPLVLLVPENNWGSASDIGVLFLIKSHPHDLGHGG